MKQDTSDITVILDRSGSMQSVLQDTIGGYNTFVKQQREAPGVALMTLNQFDTEFEVVYKGKNAKDVPELTDKIFIPRGMTALFDAVGKTIIETGERLAAMPEQDRPGKVIVVIITDGAENASKEYSRARVQELVKQQREQYNWEFIFLGANIDAEAVAGAMNIPASNAINYAHTAKGTTRAFGMLSENLVSYRSAVDPAARAVFTKSQREEQKKLGAKK